MNWSGRIPAATSSQLTGVDPNSPNLQNLDYTYDPVGNMTSITAPLFTATRDLLVYDDLNRLIEASGTYGENQGPKDCSYDYDAIGNIQHKCGVAYSYTNLNHPSFVNSTSDGKTYAPDLNGNTLTGDGRTFTWTADNRAATINNASGTTAMDYDYAGARLKKFGPLGLTVYPFPGYEIDADGVKIKYVQLGNELLAAKKSSGEKMFYHNDHLGGVNVITDINGLRTELMEYDPWGKLSRQESTSNAVDPSHAFTGQELDKETELYFYDGRYYDQQLARFVQPDPFIQQPFQPQNFNRYSYVLNNPYRYIDPTGYAEGDAGAEEGASGPEGEDQTSGQSGSGPDPLEDVAPPGKNETPELCGDDCSDTLLAQKNTVGFIELQRGITDLPKGPSSGGTSPQQGTSQQNNNDTKGGQEVGSGGGSGGNMGTGTGNSGIGTSPDTAIIAGTVRHGGFIEKLAEMTDKGIRSTIKSLAKNITEHIEKLADPKQALDIRHHTREIRTFREQLALARKAAISRGLLGGGLGIVAMELLFPDTLNAGEMDYLK